MNYFIFWEQTVDWRKLYMFINTKYFSMLTFYFLLQRTGATEAIRKSLRPCKYILHPLSDFSSYPYPSTCLRLSSPAVMVSIELYWYEKDILFLYMELKCKFFIYSSLFSFSGLSPMNQLKERKITWYAGRLPLFSMFQASSISSCASPTLLANLSGSRYSQMVCRNLP